MMRQCFQKIAQDEKHHVELADRIINIITNCLWNIRMKPHDDEMGRAGFEPA
ncbi:MAG: hypothetical protein JW837_12905 [Sedimentisphaerales bacterium]|nr:hypothetical protein [Sedimentisphaerales bacterium]